MNKTVQMLPFITCIRSSKISSSFLLDFLKKNNVSQSLTKFQVLKKERIPGGSPAAILYPNIFL